MRANLLSFFGGVAFATGAFALSGMQSGGPGTSISGDVREFLNAISMHDVSDGRGHMVRTVQISGLNVQIVNGNGPSGSINGAGNLIVGYNSYYGDSPVRIGSHNLVGGYGSRYLADGGVSWGWGNSSEGYQAVALGGTSNKAGASFSVALGGEMNVAGWQEYPDDGDYPGKRSVIVGGYGNTTYGWDSVISGGFSNYAGGDTSTVSGGSWGRADGIDSSVSGGLHRSVFGWGDWAAGSLWEDQ